MLWNLLAKDLSRARRNPWPYLINLALPLCITGLIGLAFGPSSHGGLGRIKIAIVDEDDSILSRFLRGATSQGDAAKHLEARFLDKEKALQQINGNEISAVLIIPKGFTRTYLSGQGPVTIELIKNPAQSFYPAIVEELLSVAVTGLNAISRNLQSDFPEWLRVLEKGGRPDLAAVSRLMIRIGDKFGQAEKYLFPPLVTYKKEMRQKEKEDGPAFNIFAYLLPGMAAMFLMMLADNSIRDLYREMQVRTFDRFRTIHHRLGPFISSKVILSMTNVLLGSAILFLGGGWIFRVHWQQPLPLALVILAFGLFASGFMALIAALAQSELRANILNNSIVLGMSFMGGGFFPARQLPAFLRDYVSPLMPNYWFIETIRSLQGGDGQMSWMVSAAKLSILGVALVAAASWIFQRALSKGARA
jgi:ABC-type multidrug transport system permease subunit